MMKNRRKGGVKDETKIKLSSKVLRECVRSLILYDRKRNMQKQLQFSDRFDWRFCNKIVDKVWSNFEQGKTYNFSKDHLLELWFTKHRLEVAHARLQDFRTHDSSLRDQGRQFC